jgi:hypothetical protein
MIESSYKNNPELKLFNNEVGFETISEPIIVAGSGDLLKIFNRHVTNDEKVAVAICTSKTVFGQPFSNESFVATADVAGGYLPSYNLPIRRIQIGFDSSKNREFYLDPDANQISLNHGFRFSYKTINTTNYRLAFDETLQDRETGLCVTFRDLMNSDVDVNFDDGFFCLFVFRYNDDSGYFNLVENYVLNFDVNKKIGGTSYAQILRSVNETSPNIWVTIDTNLDVTDPTVMEDTQTLVTNDTTILSNVIRNDYETKSLAIDYTFNDSYLYDAYEEIFTKYSDPAYQQNIRYILPVYRYTLNDVLDMNFSSTLANTRKNCISVMSTWDISQLKLLTTDADKVAYVNSQLGTGSRNSTYFSEKNSYTFCYDNMKYQPDPYTNTNRWVPIAGDVAGILDAFDKTVNTYDPPAGYSTVRFKNVIKMAYDLKDAKLKNLLANNSVNLINKDENGQWMLFDMQTNVAGDTSFRRMSVRRVVNESKRIITRLTRPVFFTANDSETRLTLTRNITTELNRLGGISSLQVICDERNNSDADQNAGVLNIDVLMVPTNYVRVIYLKIYVTKNNIGVAEQEI